MITCTRRIQFCSGHRVWKHESKCNHLHGHNYVAFFEAQAPKLDEIGRVIDFGVLKEKLGGWIDKNWDHAMLLWNSDPVVDMYRGGPLQGQRHYLMPLNPTAENMASYLLDRVCPDLFDKTGITITKVTIWETENCYAEAVKS